MTEFAKVRLATLDDLEGLMELCRLLYAENALFTTDEDLVREMLYAFTTHEPTPRFPSSGVIGVIGEPGAQLEGGIGLSVSHLWYTRDPHLGDVWNFVHPDHRRSLHARALIHYAKTMADDLHLPLLMGVVSNVRTEQKIKLFERHLPKAGAFFMYRGDQVAPEKAA